MSERERVRARLRKRYAAERRFRLGGVLAVGTALAALVVLLASVLWQGVPAFFETRLTLDVPLPEATLDPGRTREPFGAPAPASRAHPGSAAQHNEALRCRTARWSLAAEIGSALVEERGVDRDEAFTVPLADDADTAHPHVRRRPNAV